MKKSELYKKLQDYIDNQECYNYCINVESILEIVEEVGMVPPKYINPKAIEEGLDDPKWGYIQFIDKYPEHHFTYKNPRPYEYYLKGYEDEEE